MLGGRSGLFFIVIKYNSSGTVKIIDVIKFRFVILFFQQKISINNKILNRIILNIYR